MTAYWDCVVCDHPIDLGADGEPHTDEATGGDCHGRCCTFCADPHAVPAMVPGARDGFGPLVGHGVMTQGQAASGEARSTR